VIAASGYRPVLPVLAPRRLLPAILVVGIVAVIAAMVTRQPVLIGGLVGGLIVLVVGMRWPVVPLLLYVAVIPIDEIVTIGPLGTVGRAAAILFAISYALPRLRRLNLDVMPLAGWAYLGWALLSTVWAIDPITAGGELGTLVQLFAGGLLIADLIVARPSLVPVVMWTYSIACGLVSLVGIAEYFAGNVVAGARAAALPGQDPAQFAAEMLPALIFALFQLVRGPWRVTALAVASACGFAILLSGTRGAWVSAVVVIVLTIVPRIRPTQRLAAAGLTVLVVLGLAQVPAAVDLITSRAGNAISTGGAGRTDIWTVGLEIIASSPVVGVGYANFPVAFTPELVFATPVAADTGVARAPHDIVIGTVGELGIVGMLALAAFLGPLLVRRGWGPYADEIRACLLSLAGAALFVDVLGNRKQVWLIIGIAAALAYLAKHRQDVEAVPDASAGPAPQLASAAGQGGA